MADNILNNIYDVFKINPDILAVRISTFSNTELLRQFKEFFSRVADYETQNVIEETQLLEISRVFKEEIVDNRLAMGSRQEVVELITVVQELMKNVNYSTLTYYERNLIRIYVRSMKILKKRGFDKSYIKKEIIK
jgi:hypothetical protein